jgi:hypothetical protein
MDWGDKRALGAVMSAVVSSVLASGCGWPVKPGDLNMPSCVDGVWKPIAGLQPETTFGHLSVWQAGVDLPPEVIDESGDLCDGATDRDACVADYNAVELWSNHLRTTEGDDVFTWSGEEEIAGFLGEIDSGAEALMMAWSLGDSVVCDNVDETGWMESGSGWQVVTSSYTSICSPIVRVRTLREVASDGSMTVLEVDEISRSSACIGRRPPGLRGSDVAQPDEVACWLAEAARLEAASVDAFERLAEELAALGAPSALVEAALEAAQDERRHARDVGALAMREGAVVGVPVVEPRPLRDLEALARDNAVEGCVRETFGAVVGLWQAQVATDVDVARVMSVVAVDEVGHAALAWRIAAWAEPLLSERARGELAQARQAAVVQLRQEVAGSLPRRLSEGHGVPDGAVAGALVEGLQRSLWAA